MSILKNLNNLNVSEACFRDIINIVEETINEVSDKFIRKALENAEDKIKDIQKLKQNGSTETDKAIEDAVDNEKRRIELAKQHFEDRVVKRAKDEYEKSKKEKGN